ncbi:hypothetical protein HOP50_01g08910 [Chloropicon primus]|uniref:Haloacid dehalogenase-like hydrolase n=2 Tax=Chloropicon primus TaxID=1764295 RepID=A0A5B8MCX8_9CHLO|nr:hypothetical protein A3770_01p09040 [Chloropicon primus]UPQ97596.1 hypothetical protein HOP50_01g08910 [Chloropicon primus]|eukprot:QDZ18386.1 hypothetical protein A3770_01p09040 [Chloropicon primus]
MAVAGRDAGGWGRPVVAGGRCKAGARSLGCRASRGKVAKCEAVPRSVLALDFDGVICNSAGESSVSAWRASEKYWPQVYAPGEVQARQDDVIDETSAVRPIVETGYENMLLSRALVEGKASVGEILEDWGGIMPRLMEEWDVNRDELVIAFGDTRDAWIKEDEESWVGKNSLYPSVAGALQTALEREDVLVYIVTTKQTRYVVRILKQLGEIDFPESRIISSTVSGIPKSTTLCRLMANHPDVSSWHFVEDRFKTLEGIRSKQDGESAEAADLRKLNLYLVDWGFNTEQERGLASEDEKIDLITLSDFSEMLESGF